MTDVLNDALTWGAVIMASGSILTLIKFWLDAGKLLERVNTGAQERVILTAKLDLMASGISDFKVEVARTYATNKALSETESALANGLRDAVQGIYSRLDAMTSRLDSLVTIARHGEHK